MRILLSLCSFFIGFQVFAQYTIPIRIDGKFDDWNVENIGKYLDTKNDGNKVDFTELAITNDDKYIYFRLKFREPLKLLENNKVALCLDLDFNWGTGYLRNNFGMDMAIYFGYKKATYYIDTLKVDFNLNDIGFVMLPTTVSNEYELAMPLDLVLFDTLKVFKSEKFQVSVNEFDFNGDILPNEGSTIFHKLNFGNKNNYQALDIQRKDTFSVRFTSFNTEHDGFTDANRHVYYKRILQSLKPEIICFNEMWKSTESDVEGLLNSVLTLPYSQKWNVKKLDGNITASQYPILNTWDVKKGSRILATEIEVPESLSPTKRLLLLNLHLSCCNKDKQRQEQADAIAQFLVDARTKGGNIDLAENTPIIIMGDFNLVGDYKQLETLLQGKISNEEVYGSWLMPDWNGSALTDLLPFQTHRPMAYTWFDPKSAFPAGRLDYVLYSGSNLKSSNAFILNTNVIPGLTLDAWKLKKEDTDSASDHFPIVVDFYFDTLSVKPVYTSPENAFHAFYNTENKQLNLVYYTLEKNKISVKVEIPNAKKPLKFKIKAKGGLGELQRKNIELPKGEYSLYFNSPKWKGKRILTVS